MRRQWLPRALLVLGVALTACLIPGCTQFPTIFDRIESDETRMLDMIYDPPEALPGDTVHVRAVFAGKPVAAADVEWKISYDVLYNGYSSDTAINVQSLGSSGTDGYFSPNTYCVDFSFKIPDSIMYTTTSLPEKIIDMAPPEKRKDVPPELAGLTKSELIQTVDLPARLVRSLPPDSVDAILDGLGLTDSTLRSLRPLVQLLTVRIRLFPKIAGRLDTESDYVVRYNSAFAKASRFGIYQNTNPHIVSVGIYKVKGAGLMSFDPEINSQSYTLYPLHGASDGRSDTTTVVIDKGYTYFMASFADSMDTALSFSEAVNDSPASGVETFYHRWFLQHDTSEVADVSRLKQMSIPASTDGPITVLTPARDRRAENVIVWVQVYDYFLGEMFRPSGSSLYEARVRFEYTKGYLDSVK